MLLGRAFVFGVSLRGLLAVAAMALAVAYALIATGAMAGLQTSSATIEDAQAEPGWVVFDPSGGAIDAVSFEGALLLREGTWNGTRLATVEPWPFGADDAYRGGHLSAQDAARVPVDGLNVSRAPADYAPAQAFTLPPERFHSLVAEGDVVTTAAFVPGREAPALPGGLRAAPWIGVGVFYEEGAQEVVSSLVLLVVASAAIVALLSSGFVHLEVLARKSDYATVSALVGRKVVHRLVLGRALVLVGASIVVGVAASRVVFRVASATGAEGLRFDPLMGPALVLATAVAGVVAGTFAGRRALDRSEAQGTRSTGGIRRFRGPVRFLTVTPRISPGILAAVLLAGLVLTGVLQAAAVPTSLFGTRSDEIVLVEAAANPLRGHADRFLGEHARHLEGVRDAWPETFAPTAWRGTPLLVKGVDFDAWRDGTSPRLDHGSWPEAPDEVSLGWRTSARLGLEVGDTFTVPRSYHRGVETLTLVGVHRTGGLEDDQALSGLDVAGRLAGLPVDKVTLVRVFPERPDTPWSALAPSAGIEIVDITIEPERPAPHTPAVVTVQAINFAARDAVRPIAVRLDGNLSAQDELRLPAHGVSETRYPVITPGSLLFDITVNPSRQVGATADVLRVTAPERVRPEAAFTVLVRDSGGGPALEGAQVLADGEPVAVTGPDGRAQLSWDAPGLVVLSARYEDRSGGTQTIVAPASWDGTTHLVAERIFVGAARYDRAGDARVPVETTLVNLGTVAEVTTLSFVVDGNETVEEEVRVGVGRRATLTTWIPVEPGEHRVGVLERTVTFTVGAPADAEEAGAPRSIEEAIAAYAESQRARRGTSRDAAGDFLDRTFEGIGSATSVVVVATVLHAGSLVWVTVVREAREREGVQRTLRVLGAAHHRVEGRVLRDTFLSLLPSLLFGSLLAAGLLAAGRAVGWPRAFGHTLPTAGSWDILLRSAATVLVVGLLAAFYVAQSRLASSPGRAVREPVTARMEAWR